MTSEPEYEPEDLWAYEREEEASPSPPREARDSAPQLFQDAPAASQASAPSAPLAFDEARALEVLQKYWGYSSFRALQREAIESAVTQQDSVVVLPTGGGKSLCYQVPAMLRDGMAVVVSPLIALMKDQVDSLRASGISAAAVNSSLSYEERRDIANQVREGQIKVLYVAPERLCTERMIDFLSQQKLSFLAVDEAHCISSWGHNFRPEYRLLGQLRERLPHIDFHAYTATATEQVREDIAAQLHLREPKFLVGNFDRPNLTYRLRRRRDLHGQVREVIDRYLGESGIIYCISRKQVEELNLYLQESGYRSVAYHAGMDHALREKAQDDFLNEQADIVVATVAFGMGIDKSNVRYVIHASATKSIENYQQETGRAGRDGLPAECCLFFGGNDFATWKRLLSDLKGPAAEVAETQLQLKSQFCNAIVCRHRALVEHFGQTYERENCGACDVCLEELEELPDALIISQKILSCVVRVQERFGGDYVANVLIGSREQRLLDNQHDQLSTYGLLKNHTKKEVRDWVEQLLSQGCLKRDEEYGSLSLTPLGRLVFKKEHTPRLLKPAITRAAAKGQRNDLNEQELALFEELRQLRRTIAAEKQIAPFVVFGDVTLVDLARRRPTTLSGFLQMQGVGRKKCDDYGEPFLAVIQQFCQQHGLETQVTATSQERLLSAAAEQETASKKWSASGRQARDLFRQGKTLQQVSEIMGRALSTTAQYLTEYIEREQLTTAEPWVDAATFQKVAEVAMKAESGRLSPLYEALNQQVPYDQIRVVIACLKNRELS